MPEAGDDIINVKKGKEKFQQQEVGDKTAIVGLDMRKHTNLVLLLLHKVQRSVQQRGTHHVQNSHGNYTDSRAP